MDFFAQAYTKAGTSSPHRATSPLPSPRIQQGEGTCKGYGSEANAHLRRASSGLEHDVGYHGTFGYHSNHTSHGSQTHIDHRQDSHSQDHHRSPTRATVSHDVGSPESGHQRRTSVSNPCLLHHTNSMGVGAVRPPVMPQSRSSSSPSLVDDTRETRKETDPHVRAKPIRSFSIDCEPTITE